MTDTAFGWGSDVPVSMPEPLEDEDRILIDMGSHVFTPGGMKLYASPAVRAEIVASALLPVDEGDAR